MTFPIAKTSFAGGELSPTLMGRVDLDKYKVGAAVMRNFFVDYRGGASTRAGTQHVGLCRRETDAPAPRLIPFVFSTEQAYVLELNNNRMRVISGGAYVLNTPLAVTAVVSLNPLVVTVPGHPWSVGDFINADTTFVGLVRPNGISGINGRALRVQGVAGNDVTLGRQVLGGYIAVDASTWTPWVSGGTLAEIYSIVTPWNGDVLFELNFAQSADVLTVVHPLFQIYDIRRLGLTNWQITAVTFGATIAPPSSVTVTPLNNVPANPQYIYLYVVTSIDGNGRESNASGFAFAVNSGLDQANAVVNRLTWSAVSGATQYRVYKAFPVPNGTQGGGPYTYGIVASVFEPVFVDVNYAPDFAVSPPIASNPLSDRGIVTATITNPGQGYISPYLVISDASGAGGQVALVSDTGLGASPYGELISATVTTKGTNYTAPTGAVFDAAPLGSGLTLAFSGAWVPDSGSGFIPAPGSITIANGGSNYHQATYTNFVAGIASGSPVVGKALSVDVTQVVGGIVTAITWSIFGPPGTGLSSAGGSDTIDFTIIGADTPASGGTVSLVAGAAATAKCVSFLDQRKVYAGNDGAPSTFWMSRPGQYNNFDTSEPPQDDDAITATVSANEVNIISSLTPVTNGLIALTTGGAYLINGGGQGGVVSPTTVQANPQIFSGAADLAPLRVGNNVLYLQARGSAVRDLAFNIYTNNFTGQDVSVMSAHLLDGRVITQWGFAEEPFKLVWAVRDDGILLSLTYLKEQDVYGWARHDTAGFVVSVCVIPEGREDAVYLTVRRYTSVLGLHYATERMAARTFGANPAAGVASDPEKAWCVDAGAAYPLTTPNATLTSVTNENRRQIANAAIDAAGSGYPNLQFVPVIDLDGPGSGGVVRVAAAFGAISTVTVTAAGAGYVRPQVNVPGGNGDGVVSVTVINPLVLNFDTAIFSALDVGKVVRFSNGIGTVLSAPSATSLRCDMQRFPVGVPNLPDPGNVVIREQAPGTWSLTAPVTTIGGLDHLNGATVQVLADGSVQAPKIVTDGCITLDAAATAIVAGQGFSALLQTPRLDASIPGAATIQGDRKLLSGVTLRKTECRGIQIGSSWTDLVEIADRNVADPMGDPTPFEIGGELIEPPISSAPSARAPMFYRDSEVNMHALWSEEGIVCIQQAYPLPATVLAIIPNVTVGDDG
jgi:hypothetical protein